MRRYSGITRAILYDSAGNFVAFDKLSSDTVINDQPQATETTVGEIHAQNAVDFQLAFFDFTSAKVAQLNSWMLAGTDVRAMMIGESTSYNFFKLTEPLSVYLEPTNARDGVRKGFVAGTFIGANYNDMYVTQQIAELFGKHWDIMKKASWVYLASAERVAQTVFPSADRATTTRASVKLLIDEFAAYSQLSANLAPVEFDTSRDLRGSRIEPVVTNLLARSSDFTDAYFTKTGVTPTLTSDATVGVCTLLDEGVATSEHSVSRPSLFSAEDNRSLEIAIKNVSGARYVYLTSINSGAFTGGTGGRISFVVDLETGTVAWSGTNFTSADIQSLGNGWWRISGFGAIAASGSGGQAWRLGFLNANNQTESYTGTGKQMLVAWGGAYAGKGVTLQSPVITDGSAITRAADVIEKASSTSIIGQTQGSVYFDIFKRARTSLAARTIATLSDDTSANRLLLQITTGDAITFVSTVASVDTGTITDGTASRAGRVKGCSRYVASGNDTLHVAGASVGTPASFSHPACSQINVGSNAVGALQLNDWLSALVVFDEALTEAEANQLTA